jgi:hypothetical protein
MRIGPLLRITLLSTGLCVAAATAARAQSLEYAVKATDLAKFAPFIAWSAPAAKASPFLICVVGNDPFGRLIDQAVAGQEFGRRPAVVRRIAEATHGMGCHVLYVGGGGSQSAGEVMAMVRGESVLTVTDAARSPDARGVVHFWMSGGRVRFDIDQVAAAAHHLSISSKLMALAGKAPR